MATIFSDVLNFLGTAFKDAVSIDMLRDYRHASELFVGNDFSLVPKSGYLFHVFFDINPFTADSLLLDPTRQTEIGMLVKDAELPRFSIDAKVYNSYNRPNIVQSKIKYDPVNITFRDDSVNLIRNFWFDYYSYYYRDTLNRPEVHRRDYKYTQSGPNNFGYNLRYEVPDYRYLHAIRIYSLTHNQFSEYILVNPMITAFRHPRHDYESNESANMAHEMTIQYEGVFYNEGLITTGSVKGFALLHYDRNKSPLNRVGARRSIFGRGGLINAASSIITDISRGNYLSAIFNFATARQSFKGVNIKKAAVNELKQIYTASATNAITGLINQQMRSTTPGGYSIISSKDILGSTTSQGISQIGSALALTGVAALLNTKQNTSNKYKETPVVQSNPSAVKNTYVVRFPSVPGVNIPNLSPLTVLKANDGVITQTPTNQAIISNVDKRIELNQRISSIEAEIKRQGQNTSIVQRQINNLTIIISNLNSKLSTAISANANKDIVDGIKQQITTATFDKQNNESLLAQQSAELTVLTVQLNQALAERNTLPNG